MTSNLVGAASDAAGQAALARVLDLLDQQRRRIVELTGHVAAGRRALERSTVSMNWRSPARTEFDLRLDDLQQVLARCQLSLAAALTECDRARTLLRTDAGAVPR